MDMMKIGGSCRIQENVMAKYAKLLAAAVALGLVCGVQADVETDDDGITWKYSTYTEYADGRYVKVAHLGSDAISDFPIIYKTIGKSVSIPSLLGGYAVRRLYSFNDYNWITELTIPEGVSIVYGIRLAGCRRIEFPESLKSFLFLTSLGENATNVDDPLWNEDDPRPFYGLTNVTEAVLPQVVLDMGHIFQYMPNLERAIIRDNVTEARGFNGCSKLTEVEFPSNGSVTSIRGQLTEEQVGAFENCTGLSSITIPNSVTNMGFRAFDGCANLTSITIPFVGQCRGRYRKNYKGETINDSGMEQFASDLSDRIRSITITDDIDPGDYGFANMHVATNITLSANMDNIGTWAFGGCWELPSIIIPDGVTNIGERAFYNCRSLKSVKIGAGVKTIHSTAFSTCTGIVEVCIPQFISGQTLAISRVFPHAYSNLTNVIVSEGATSIGNSAFWGCRQLSSVTIPSTVKIIGDGAFSTCTNLLQVTISEGVESIGSEAFANCTNLVQVTIPEGVKTIGDRAFANCKSMKKVFMPLSLYGKVGSSVFEGCGAELEVVYAKVEITAAAEHGGRVTGGGSYDCGTRVTLRAVPDSGYAFSHWTGAASSSQNPIVVTADAAKSYTAVFEPLPIAFTLVRSSTSGVSLSWNGLAWATIYRIYRGSTSVQSSAAVLAELPNNDNCTYLDDTGVVDKEYWYWVEAEGPSDEVMSDPMTGRKEKPIVYSAITYTNLCGATNPNPATYQEGTLVSFQNPGAVTGYTFAGWTPSQITADMTGAQTVRAAWTANSYAIVYNANGGSGTMNATAATYDSEATVAMNGFTWAGHVFSGWATNETGEVVYVAGQPVTNLTAQSGGVVTLYAVWEPLVVAAPVVTPADGTVFTEDSCTVAISCATEGATIYYGVNAVPRGRANEVYTAPFTISDTATIYAFAKKDGVSSGNPVAVTITRRVLSLGDAASAGAAGAALSWTTGGDANWTPIVDATAAGGYSAQSGAVGDSAAYGEWNETWLETTVSGAGTATFWWKVDCEDDGSPDDTWDHASFFVDGIEVAHMDGNSGWRNFSHEIAAAGTHTLRWSFFKDDYNEDEFADRAWVSGFAWTPSSLPDVPSVPGDPDAIVTGDAESGFTVKPSATSGVVEVTIPDGVDAAKVTVEVSPTVESVTPHGAAIKIVKGGHDITDLLDIPAADGEGAVATQLATVKEAIVKETLDTTKGAEIDLKPSAPSITTAPTRPGLTYTFKEGATIEGMTQKAEKQGDGQPWTPTISVKDGPSGFYSIGVGK